MDNTELINGLNKELPIELPQNISQHEILNMLSEAINHLVQTDFQKLVFILYKTDVSENKLKGMLNQNSHEDAALIIAKLIIERQSQKIKSRNLFSNRNDIPEDEKW